MTKTIMVTGGAGYIGSFICKSLSENGYRPVVVDDFSTGFIANVKWGDFEKCDLKNTKCAEDVVKFLRPDVIIHAAGSISVEESQANPQKYFHNNSRVTLNLLDACRVNGVKNFIFSSTAAVYAPSEYILTETSAIGPISNYGISKLHAEAYVQAYSKAYRLNSIIFRYFNAAGASTDGSLGDRKTTKTHLIPSLVEKALTGDDVTIHGFDYSTRDGTAIRDFIHVEDISDAHTLACSKMLNHRDQEYHEIMNLSTGIGTSVNEVVEICRTQLGHLGLNLRVKTGPRRSGDAQTLISDASKARELLNWSPRKDLLGIVRDTIQFTLNRNRKDV